MKLSPAVRKLLGIALIVIFGLCELVFGLVLIMSLFSNSASTDEIFSPIFVISIFAFPIWWGKGLLQSARAKKIWTGEFEGTRESVTISTTISVQEYRKLMFLLTYTRPLFIYIHIVAIGILIPLLLSGIEDWYTVFIGLLLFYLPIGVFIGGTRQYKSTKSLHEQIVYIFTPENIILTGDSYNSTIKWDSLFKARETNKWILLYTNNIVMVPVPKRAFATPEEIEWVRNRMSYVG